MQDIFKTFSCGSLGVVPLVLQTVSRVQAQSIVHGLLKNHGVLFDQIAPGMRTAVISWVEEADADLWNRVFSRLERSAQEELAVPHSRLVELGLAATCASKSPIEPWTFLLGRPSEVWLDRWLFTDVTSGSISCTPNVRSINLITLKGNICIDIGADGIPHCSSTAEIPQADHFPRVEYANGSVLVLNGSAIDAEIIPEYADAKLSRNICLDTFGQNIFSAFALLKAGSPNFATWVSSVLRYVCPLKMSDNQLGSSSSPWDWGMLAITDTPYISSIAEMLVHESSHQIFFLAKRFGPMDDGTDRNSYFSPMARQNRTLERILLAYHALANIALMYIDFIENRAFDAAHCMRQLDKAAPKLQQMQAVLEGNPALTELGASIYKPLNTVLVRRMV